MRDVRRYLEMPTDGPMGRGVRIAIIDTGADVTHPDLDGRVNLTLSQSFVPSIRGGNQILDRYYHGTHIAGIIGGTGKGSAGEYRGIAPEAELIVYRVAEDGRALEGNIFAAIEAAIEAQVDIINYSISFSPHAKHGPPPWAWANLSDIEDAFEHAAKQGILCVVAAGNDGDTGPRTPAFSSINRPGGSPYLLTVGSVDCDGRAAANSSRGPYIVLDGQLPNYVGRVGASDAPELERREKPDLVAPGKAVIAPRATTALPQYRQELESNLPPDRNELWDPLESTCRHASLSIL